MIKLCDQNHDRIVYDTRNNEDCPLCTAYAKVDERRTPEEYTLLFTEHKRACDDVKSCKATCDTLRDMTNSLAKERDALRNEIRRLIPEKPTSELQCLLKTALLCRARDLGCSTALEFIQQDDGTTYATKPNPTGSQSSA